MSKKASTGKMIPVTLPNGENTEIPYNQLAEFCPLPRSSCESLWELGLSEEERCRIYESVLKMFFYGIEPESDDTKFKARFYRFWVVIENKRKKALNPKGPGEDAPTMPKQKKEKANKLTGEIPKAPTTPGASSPAYETPQDDDSDDYDDEPMLDPPASGFDFDD